MTVDLYERAGAQQGIHRTIIHADKSVLAIAHIQFLDKRYGNFSPDFDHPGNQAGGLHTESAVKAHWKTDGSIPVGYLDGS
jgi:hypothetical protein